MFIATIRRCLKSSLLGVGLLAGTAGCGLIDPPPPAEEVLADESGDPVQRAVEQKARLQWMHDQVTMVFIGQPQFGIRRIAVPSPDNDIVQGPKTPVVQNQPQRGVTAGVQTPHGNFKTGVEGLGLNEWFSNDPVEPLSFRQVRLVGLVMHADPVIYESDDVAMGTDTVKIPTRPLDAFESRGLQKLKEGEDLYTEKLSTDKMRVLGPIYAGPDYPGVGEGEQDAEPGAAMDRRGPV